jgi:phage FluMu protein Com
MNYLTKALDRKEDSSYVFYTLLYGLYMKRNGNNKQKLINDYNIKIIKMMKNIWCRLGSHKYYKWKLVKEYGITDELERKCSRCGEVDKYSGMIEVCIVSGDKSPYIFKH